MCEGFEGLKKSVRYLKVFLQIRNTNFLEIESNN